MGRLPKERHQTVTRPHPVPNVFALRVVEELDVVEHVLASRLGGLEQSVDLENDLAATELEETSLVFLIY
jgi:hypothetical protein